MSVSAIRPRDFPWFRYEGYTFSLGLQAGPEAWLSGHSASQYDPESGRIVVLGGMGEQTQIAYDKIAAILDAAGLSLADVTHLTENVTVTGIEAYAEAEQVRLSVLGEHRPVVSTVVVDRLLRPKALIEIEVHATAGGGEPLRISDDGRWRHEVVRAEPDGTVRLPTILPLDAAGEVVAEGDFRGQYTYCLTEAGRLLEAVGMGLGQVVTTYDYSTPDTRDEYGRCARPRRELLGGAGVFPAAGGILMSRLHRPGVLVALEVTASRTPLEVINPGWTRYDTLTYSPGVRAGRTLFMSGFAALDPQTQLAVHAGDIVAQAEYTYNSVLAVLAAAGGGPEHLVSTIEYVCPDGLADYRGVAAVRQRMLRDPWPASTGAVCAALLRPEFLLEVFPTAVLP